MSHLSSAPPSLDPAMVTTALELPGYRIVRNIGVVRGIVVRSRNVFATIGAGLQTLVGGDITLFTELCEKTRQDSFAMMTLHAAQLGANAVIATRYDANEIMRASPKSSPTAPPSSSKKSSRYAPSPIQAAKKSTASFRYHSQRRSR